MSAPALRAVDGSCKRSSNEIIPAEANSDPRPRGVVRRETFWGFTKFSWGSGGRCESPSGVRGSAPEDFEINAFQRLRTPVSLTFNSYMYCCSTKIHTIFLIHSHPRHLQPNEVVPAGSHALIQKSQSRSMNCPLLNLVLYQNCDGRS